MTAEYDAIAAEYTRMLKKYPGRLYVIDPSFIKAFGNIKGKTVLDLACGSGHFTRELKKLKARTVMGIDISQEMLRLAKEEEKKKPQGITYRLIHASKLPKLGEYDLITAGFLLHYAKSEKELQGMCNSIAKNLKRNGRFIALNNNPAYAFSSYPSLGIIYHGTKKTDGSKITMSFKNLDKDVELTIYYWNKRTYERCLKKAGMKNIKWKPLTVTKKGIKKYGKDFFQKFLDNPSVIMIEAYKN